MELHNTTKDKGLVVLDVGRFTKSFRKRSVRQRAESIQESLIIETVNLVAFMIPLFNSRINPRRLRTDRWRNDSLAKWPVRFP